MKKLVNFLFIWKFNPSRPAGSTWAKFCISNSIELIFVLWGYLNTFNSKIISVLFLDNVLTPKGHNSKLPLLKILKIDLLLGVKSNQKNFFQKSFILSLLTNVRLRFLINSPSLEKKNGWGRLTCKLSIFCPLWSVFWR